MHIIQNLKPEYRLQINDSNIKLIFEQIGKILTENNLPLTYEFMVKLIDKLGLDTIYTKKSLDVLNKIGYVSYNRHASGEIFNIKLTWQGVIAYCINFMENFDSKFEIISSEILDNYPCTNENIHKKTNIPKPIVNAIMDYYYEKGFVQLHKTASDTRTVYHIN